MIREAFFFLVVAVFAGFCFASSASPKCVGDAPTIAYLSLFNDTLEIDQLTTKVWVQFALNRDFDEEVINVEIKITHEHHPEAPLQMDMNTIQDYPDPRYANSYIGAFTISACSYAGLWTLSHALLVDEWKNAQEYQADDIQGLPHTLLSFNLTTPAFTTPAQLLSFSLTPTEFDVRQTSPEATIEAHISTDLPGFHVLDLTFKLANDIQNDEELSNAELIAMAVSPSSSSMNNKRTNNRDMSVHVRVLSTDLVDGSLMDGHYKTSVTLQRAMYPGNYQLSSGVLLDAAIFSHTPVVIDTAYMEKINGTSSFLVQGDKDEGAPTLLFFRMFPTRLDVSEQDQNISFEIIMTDDARIDAASIIGRQARAPVIAFDQLLDYIGLNPVVSECIECNDTYAHMIETFPIYGHNPSTTWSLQADGAALSLFDYAGNVREYTVEQLHQMGFASTSVQIICGQPPQPDDSGSSPSWTKPLIWAVVGVAGAIVIAVACYYACCRKSSEESKKLINQAETSSSTAV
eukprot:TRINITY_DN8949_c0_g1_i1.p1 TRINITY_DN8949_c0_g1~~TRINITY_DN8949_c0_g1_i1.p1  ORF type:complete len:517 (-),score=130.97 TRINITY_DN8949_c0_g1_i1:233-1783(-)